MNQHNASRSTSGPLEKGILPLAFLAFILPGLRTISHADFWTHLALGRWIAENGVPRIEPLSAAANGAPWIDANWLYDRLLYLLWSLGGPALVTGVHVLLALGAFILLARVTRTWSGRYSTAFALLLAAGLMAPVFQARPAIFCLIFPATFIYALTQHEQRAAWKLFALLLPLQWLWTNLHISFLWGPVITAVFCAQHFALSRQSQSHAAARTLSRRYGLLALALLAVTVLNPYGLNIYRAVLAAWNSAVVYDWISPYSRIFPSSHTKNLVTLALVIGASGLLTHKRKLPIALTTIAVICAFLVVRSVAVHLEIFVALSFPFLALSLHSLGQYLNKRMPTLWTTQAARTRMALQIVVLLAVALVACETLGNRYYVRTGSLSSFGLGAATAVYPAQARELLDDPAFPQRVLHLPLDGGYLAWAYPNRKIWIDQRPGLFTTEQYHTLSEGLVGRTQEWHTIETTLDPQAIILSSAWPYTPDAIRHLQMHDRWETVYFDGATVILVQNSSESASILSRRDASLTAGLARIEQDRKAYREAITRRFPLAPLPPRLMGAATIFQQRGRHKEAAALNELLTLGAPNMMTAPLNLGVSLTALGQHESALTPLRKALDAAPKDSVLWARAQIQLGINQVELGHTKEGLAHLSKASTIFPDNPLIWMWIYRAHKRGGSDAEAQVALNRAKKISPEFVEAFLKVPASH